MDFGICLCLLWLPFLAYGVLLCGQCMCGFCFGLVWVQVRCNFYVRRVRVVGDNRVRGIGLMCGGCWDDVFGDSGVCSLVCA